MSPSEETVGERLKRLRLEHGLSQRELAAPGVSYAYISRIEAGTRQPSVKALRKLAQRLDVSTGYLETGREIDDQEGRELQLVDAELALRLDDARDAEPRLEELAAQATAAGDRDQAARARIALALAAFERGDHESCVVQFEQAFALDRPSPLDRLDAYATLGRAYGALGETEREIRVYTECLDHIEALAPGNAAVRTRYRILLSYALSDAGALERAEAVVREALRDASDDDDPYMRIRLYWSLARVSEMEGRSARALRYARRAIALLETTEDDFHRGRAYTLTAWIMNSAGDGEGAEAQLDRAEPLLAHRGGADDRAILHVERARAAALLGRGADAVSLARAVLDETGSVNQAVAGTAYWALAQGLLVEGDSAGALTAFASAVELLEDNRRWREASSACRGWATLLRETGSEADALDAFERASLLALRATGSGAAASARD